jgi:hypothetical protein
MIKLTRTTATDSNGECHGRSEKFTFVCDTRIRLVRARETDNRIGGTINIEAKRSVGTIEVVLISFLILEYR